MPRESIEILEPLPPEKEKGAYGRLLSDKRFRRLWVSQFVSGLGDWLVIGLLIPLVSELSGNSSFAVAGIMIAKIIPSLFLSSFIGVFVDRFDRRKLMITCDLVRAVLALGLLFTNSLALIYTIVLLMEMASLFFMPAKNALIPYLVEEKDLALANGLSYTTQQASMLLGLTMSGAILAGFEAVVRWILNSGFPLVSQLVGPLAPGLLGPRAGVTLDALTFVVSALMIWAIHQSAKAETEGRFDLGLIGRDAIQAFKFLGAHRELRAFMTTIGFAILGGGAIIPVGVVYVKQNMSGGIPFLEDIPALQSLVGAPQTFMLVMIALGMFTGAIVVPRLAQRLSLQMLFLGGVGAFGATMFVFANVGAYWMTTFFSFIVGFCIACVTVAGNTYIAKTVADELRGRVFTTMESVIRVSLLASMVIVAPIGDIAAKIVASVVESRGIDPGRVFFTGSRITLEIASLLMLAATYYAYKNLSWRRENGKAHDRG